MSQTTAYLKSNLTEQTPSKSVNNCEFGVDLKLENFKRVFPKSAKLNLPGYCPEGFNSRHFRINGYS